MRVRRSVFYQEDLVNELAQHPSLIKNQISKELIQLIIEDYNQIKAEALVKGSYVEERNLGWTRLIYRVVAPNLQNKSNYSIKCTTLLNSKTRAFVAAKILKEDRESQALLYKLSNGNIFLEDLKNE